MASTIVYTSADEISSFEFTEPSLYRLCLTASNDTCSNTICQMVQYVGLGIEACK